MRSLIFKLSNNLAGIGGMAPNRHQSFVQFSSIWGMGVTSAIRSLALNLTLFVGLVLSHHLGGGSSSFSPYLIPMFVLSFFLFWIRPVKTIRGPYLALLLVFVQALGHFDLAANANISTVRMSLSHISGIAVSYILATNFDQGLLSILTVLRSFFEPVAFLSFNVVPIATAVPRIDSKINGFAECFDDLRKRGPPSLAVNWG